MSSEAELDTAPKAERDTAEKVETFFCRSPLWQDGHTGAGPELRTSFSNSLPQAAHLNSKMGMIVFAKKLSAAASVRRNAAAHPCRLTPIAQPPRLM